MTILGSYRDALVLKLVQQRLGHKKIEITLIVYAHALPLMQQDAAAKPAAMPH